LPKGWLTNPDCNGKPTAAAWLLRAGKRGLAMKSGTAAIISFKVSFQKNELNQAIRSLSKLSIRSSPYMG